MKRVVLVWFPDWETNALVIDCPPGTPAVSVGQGRVLHATIRARSYGIRAGMRVSLAQHLCADLVTVPYDEARSARSFYAVLDALDEVSAHVCAIAPGIAWMPASAARWFGSEEILCERALDAVALHTGSECSIGIGSGLLGAWAAARRGEIATDDSAIRQLKIADLVPLIPGDRVAEVVDSLRVLGIVSVGDLIDFGPATVASRFGDVGLALERLLTRDVPLQIDSAVVEDDLSETIEFASPVSDTAIVVGHFISVATAIVKGMVNRQVSSAAIRISATMTTPRAEVTRERLWSLTDFPTPRDITDRVRWQTQGWIDAINRTSLPEYDIDSQDVYGLTSLTVTVIDPFPIDALAARLWGQRSEEDTRASTTAFRLQALLGVDRVQRPRIIDGFDPVTRVLLETWGTVSEQQAWERWELPPRWRDHATYSSRQQWNGRMRGESPATVFDEGVLATLLDAQGQPVTIETTGALCVSPTRLMLNDGHPLLHSIGLRAGESYPVERVRGPWPILGRWWEDDSGIRGTRAWLTVIPRDSVALLLAWKSGQWTVVALWY
ncbi:MAG: DNA polymerase Y family protein [Actinomycetaceae bacterium]|nr:DNA polymerase Y family protein [Actinomycetaceae bacterium]